MFDRIGKRPPESVCTLTFDFNKEVKPLSDRAKVVNNMLILQTASLQDLMKLTGLPEKAVLSEVSYMRREFGLKGNKKTDYKLSSDPEKRVAMSQWVEKQY